MPLFVIIITVILLALVIFYITRPLFTAQPESEESTPDDPIELKESSYHSILERIRELDFEFKLGKLDRQEHEEQRASLVKEAAEALRDLRSGDSPPASSPD